MQQIADEAKSKFRRLLGDDSNEAIVELLVSLRGRTDRSVDDTGWALWNICDAYAMLRDAKKQYRYQSVFHEWDKANLSSSRLHWVVSDATQALSLIDGGFLDAWWKWYEYGNERAPITGQNRNARFESHRANAYATTYFGEHGKAETALRAIENLLQEDHGWVNRDFARVTYNTLLVDFYNSTGQGDSLRETAERTIRHLKEWSGRQQSDEHERELLLGSWDQINGDRGPEALPIAIHNAACALARTEQSNQAEVLFRRLLEEGKTLTAYGEAQYLLACWKSRHDKREIKDQITSSKGLTPEMLLRWVPELKAAVEDIDNYAD